MVKLAEPDVNVCHFNSNKDHFNLRNHCCTVTVHMNHNCLVGCSSFLFLMSHHRHHHHQNHCTFSPSCLFFFNTTATAQCDNPENDAHNWKEHTDQGNHNCCISWICLPVQNVMQGSTFVALFERNTDSDSSMDNSSSDQNCAPKLKAEAIS